MSQSTIIDCEYVVVGSGAGGGTVAARLAESGRTVILLEAGGDAKSSADDPEPSADLRLPSDYDVPAFHPFASENPAMRWDYFVRHYSDERANSAVTHYVEDKGVLYPRAGVLGGCTAHNAMICVYPHNEDWDLIAAQTSDASWQSDRMRRHFERLENCRHRPLLRWLAKVGINPARHGWNGWLTTEAALPMEELENEPLRRLIAKAAFSVLKDEGQPVERVRWFLESGLDPNDWRLVGDDSTGIRYLPLSTQHHARVGARERVLDVVRRHPTRLRVMLHTLVTRVLFDEERRAKGVEYLRGRKLYRAHAQAVESSGEKGSIRASRGVILACGAFNTPQVLLLSGIGPGAQLRDHGIPVVVDLNGVGKNLQDRYEVGVVNRMAKDWKAFDGAKFEVGDEPYAAWNERRDGIYATNGSLMTVFRRSPKADRAGPPDLFCMSLLSRFTGYYPGYSRDIAKHLNYLTWVVLKAHTTNRAGEVTLRSPDPRDPPLVDFKYFDDGGEEDLAAVVDGIRFVRKLTAGLGEDLVEEEEVPGTGVQSDEELAAFVRSHAWGHHASCSCPIGAATDGGVLSSDFRVHGTQNLYVVDASVFPRIPGFFLVSAVYMVGEKAAEVILADALT
jgi:choline dehydrogenase